MKNTFYIISDFRENFPSLNSKELRYFNDHPTRDSIKKICELINSIGYKCYVWGGVNELVSAYNHHEKMPEGIYLNMSDGLTQEYNRVQIPILCDMLNIKYSGCNAFLAALICNKHFCKLNIRDIGCLVPNGILLDKNYPLKDEYMKDISYPVIIKPNCDGSSIGLSKSNICYNIDDLYSVYKRLSKQFNELLIEEYIPGYELTNMYIGNHETCILNEVIFTKKGQTIFFENDILTQEDKSMKKTEDVLASMVVDNETIMKIKQQTADIVKKLHITDICRIDYRLTKDNQLYMLEINSVPRFNADTNTKIMAKLNGMTFETLLDKYLQYLINRFNHD